MFLYNVSIIIEDSVHQSLFDWIKQELLSNAHPNLKLLKMLYSPHEGQTYCLQIMLEDEEAIESIKNGIIQDLQEHIVVNFREKAFIFDSVMQYIPHQ
ncbi:DUF4286 family protein [Sphingobacteruim zhuxiongii]|nr:MULTISPECIES: DUF4286 family protein [unclassified Sphingobacterium]